jgi:hypothetical protein
MQYLRVRPHPTNPTRCTLDHFWYGFTGDGLSGPVLTTDGEIDRAAVVERQHYDYGAISSGLQVDQDLSQALTQQQGVRSQAYTGANLMHQEDRLQHYAEMLERHVGS